MQNTLGENVVDLAIFDREKNEDMAESAIHPPELPPLVGEDASFQAMLAHVSQLAPLDRPVLVVGERGTGKELVAARLALLSPRWDKPFLTVNCAALAESLLDSELFGHEAGAFTGAARRRLSRFELADGGTLFLDEIAAASHAVQEKVLRVIEYGTFARVGGNDVLSADVRVIAAANVDLPALAASGRFRSDLLDRLAFDVVTVPPLRARREDIPLLAEHFARVMTRTLGRAYFAGFTPAAMAVLLAASLARQCARAQERGRAQRLSLDAAASAARRRHRSIPLPRRGGRRTRWPRRRYRRRPKPRPMRRFLERVRRFEHALLRAALAANSNNQRRAAQALGLNYHQFRHYLRKHAIARAGVIARSGG